MSIVEARAIAKEAELDLVEVAPNAEPPVARVMDYGKFSYEKTKREREARKHQKQIEVKTVKLSPKIASFHRDINVRRAREWLEEGKKSESNGQVSWARNPLPRAWPRDDVGGCRRFERCFYH